MRLPDQRPSPQEWWVIAMFLGGLVVVLGAIGLIAGLASRNADPQVTGPLTRIGAVTLGVGIAIMIVPWAIERWLD